MIGGLQGMDFSKEPVDGGGISADILAEFGRKCRATLQHLAEVIGEAFNLLSDVLGRGMFLAHAAAARGIRSQWGVLKLSKVFKDSLQLLATKFLYA